MTFFFFVTGFEARRELDLGELRERRRLVLPLLAAAGGMAASVAIYLAFKPGRALRRRLGNRAVQRRGAGAGTPRSGGAAGASAPTRVRPHRPRQPRTAWVAGRPAR